MTACVLDACSVLAWCFEDEGGAEADVLIDRVAAGGAAVPAQWSLEVAEGLVAGERRRRISPAESATFIAMLEELPIGLDAASGARALHEAIESRARAPALGLRRRLPRARHAPRRAARDRRSWARAAPVARLSSARSASAVSGPDRSSSVAQAARASASQGLRLARCQSASAVSKAARGRSGLVLFGGGGVAREVALDRGERRLGAGAVGAAALGEVGPPAAALAAELGDAGAHQRDRIDGPARSSETLTTSAALPSTTLTIAATPAPSWRWIASLSAAQVLGRHALDLACGEADAAAICLAPSLRAAPPPPVREQLSGGASAISCSRRRRSVGERGEALGQVGGRHLERGRGLGEQALLRL